MITKIERHYQDGHIEYLDGENLENYLKNIEIANGFATSRSYIQFLPVNWSRKEPDTILDRILNNGDPLI